ncbi:MAG: MSHA biogenesis protein MshI [Halopseudomonas sp.]
MTLNETGLALAHYDDRQSNPLRCLQLDQCRIDTPELLKTAVVEWGVSGCATSWVLKPKEYHLLLVEAPAVADDEMAEALRWRIKDMISFDVAEAVIDYFPLPDDAYRGRSKMLYVAVIEPSLSQNILSMTQAAGLVLETIDIPELALLRLKALEGDTLGTAVLGLQSPTSIGNLVCDDDLYLTRQVETPADLIADDAQEIESRASNMVLDLQRSLDYYESQIGKPPCLRLLVCPLQPGETPLLGQLRYNLPVEVVQLDLGEHFSCDPPLTPALQLQVMMAVAAVLPEQAS